MQVKMKLTQVAYQSQAKPEQKCTELPDPTNSIRQRNDADCAGRILFLEVRASEGKGCFQFTWLLLCLTELAIGMALTESSLPAGRISRNLLCGHLRASSDMPALDLCKFSSRDFDKYVACVLISVKHTNSCLQRTMIKQWRYGFCETKVQLSVQASRHSPDPSSFRVQLMHQERQRLTFIKEYRTAHTPVSVATDKAEALLQFQTRKWGYLGVKQRHHTVAALQDILSVYHNAVADLVLDLLPGRLFLEVLTQEDAGQIFDCCNAKADQPVSCLSTHLSLCASG